MQGVIRPTDHPLGMFCFANQPRDNRVGKNMLLEHQINDHSQLRNQMLFVPVPDILYLKLKYLELFRYYLTAKEIYNRRNFDTLAFPVQRTVTIFQLNSILYLKI